MLAKKEGLVDKKIKKHMEKTIKNLSKAFVGESQARNRYAFYAKVAKQEGYEQISEIFLITADNEKEHAKRLFEHIQELKSKSLENLNEIIVSASCPTTLGNTIDNLKAAIDGEDYEYAQMYPEFADIAEEEKLDSIAKRLRAIAMAEKHHEERFIKLLKQVEGNTTFKKDKEVDWVCRECGYPHYGPIPPDKCPSCDHEKSFYQIKCEEY